jgi:hypothetical protein
MSKITRFEIRNMNEFNPFADLAPNKRIFLKADNEGLYTLHIHHGRGFVYSSAEKLTLCESMNLAMGYCLELGYPDNSLAIDLPAHVLEIPDVLNARLKQRLLTSGKYFTLYGDRRQRRKDEG